MALWRSSSLARRLRLLFLSVLALAVMVVAVAIGVVLWTESKIDKFDAEELPALSTPSESRRTILVVGTDDRSNLPDDFEGNFGNFGGRRPDVIMLVQVVSGEGALILSLPRDLRVEIPGYGTNKINATYAFGGPDLLIETISGNLGIEINNYIEIDFLGFANVVDALGGVEIEFDRAARDKKSGFEVPAGTQLLSGAQALGYARSRQYEELTDSGWGSRDGGDIGRTGRQQELLLAVFEQVATAGNTFRLPGFVNTFAEHIQTDAAMGTSVLLELGRVALSLGGSNIEARTLPVEIVNDGRSYVVPVEPQATAVLDAFRAGISFPASN